MRYRQTNFDFIQAESARLVDSRLQPCISGAQTIISSLYKSLSIPYPILRVRWVSDTNRVLPTPLCSAHINFNSTWKRNGVTVAGGNGPGTGTNQLNVPHGLFLDNDQTLYIAEWSNHRIVERKNWSGFRSNCSWWKWSTEISK
ncbi:unnamed protein product [Rotaria socialis]|uniref:NHL repeat-containing protein n=1 Tax=Rotaria socialis TaxID=392032 RepID=A0A821FMJ9_9BILA|nr:unnamed protein product [Rotaria socialis]